jgi:hypothetical protein
MLRTLVAYAVAWLLAPTVSGLVEFLFFPIKILMLPKPKDGNPRTPARVWSYAILGGFASVLGAFAAVWFARVVFRWLGVEAILAIAVMIGISFTLNDLRRLKAAAVTGANAPVKAAQLVGDLSGVVLGAVYLL